MSIRRAIGVTFPTRNLSAIERDPDELRHGAQISIWVRWIILVGVMAEVNYRVDYGAVSHILNTLYVASAMALNGYVHYRIRSNKAIGARWLCFSALRMWCTSLSVLHYPVDLAADTSSSITLL